MRLLIISIPLISSISILIFGRYIGNKGGKIISISSIILSTIISFTSLLDYLNGKIFILDVKEWFSVGQIIGNLSLLYDKESIIMISLISSITMIVIIYSYWYLNNDPHINRFISNLLAFAVTMYILVSSKNILFSFAGWEGVGLISFLLINFWSISIQNSKSAIKAIIFNKIGDTFYLLGLIIIATWLDSFDYLHINSFCLTENHVNTFNIILLCILSFSLILASMAKSAQIFLHCWLGDAMAGPTPVSALLHAATMVTAGIFLVIRSKVIIFESIPYIHNFIFLIGSLTILFAGLAALNQYDIKKIIAYSTCSQIGFMFFALALFKPIDSSIYHLLVHGFFKALLFLSAGLLIHSLLLEQDLRKFGNLLFNFPLFYIFFFIGTLSIIAFPSFSGFFSKELILYNSLNYPIYYFILLFIGSLFSSLYSFKILFFSFFNTTSFFNTHLSHCFPFYSYIFVIPFFFLLLGSIFLGFFSSSLFSSPETINISLETSLINNFSLKLLILLLPLFAIILIFFQKRVYKNYILNNYLYKIISLGSRKFFFDTFYNYFFVKPIYFLSYHFLYKILDRGYLEYLGPISLFRLFFFFPKYFNLNNQFSSNVPFIFFYFFISFSLFFLSFFLLI